MLVEVIMGCGVWWQQVHEVEKALATMARYGIDPGSEAVVALQGTKAKLMTQIGYKFPRSYNWLTFLIGESPGTIRLGHDAETGWFAEARVRPGAPPIYHRLVDEEAMAVLQHEIPPELHDRLFTPDPYIGE